MAFGIEKAYEKRVKFQKNYHLKAKSKHNRAEVLFYFTKKPKLIKFTLFDYFLSSVDFNSKYIFEKKQKLKEEYNVFEKFEKKYLNDGEKVEQKDYGYEEVDSDE